MPIRTSEFLFAASLLLPGAALIAQTPTPGAVCGTVRGPLFDPIVNAEVAVYTPDWQLLREGRTDGSGQYAFSGLGSGWVYVCARAPGLTRASPASTVTSYSGFLYSSTRKDAPV